MKKKDPTFWVAIVITTAIYFAKNENSTLLAGILYYEGYVPYGYAAL